jgi:hypothetical protein
VERRYCIYCGNRLEPDARFCSNCGKPVHRSERPPETDAPTAQLPTAQPPRPQPPQPQPAQPQPRWAEARSQTVWRHAVETRAGISWPAIALLGVFLILFVVENVQGGMSGAIRATLLVAGVVLVASAVSYLSLLRRGGATFRGAVFNRSVVVLAAFATFLFLVS